MASRWRPASFAAADESSCVRARVGLLVDADPVDHAAVDLLLLVLHDAVELDLLAVGALGPEGLDEGVGHLGLVHREEDRLGEVDLVGRGRLLDLRGHVHGVAEHVVLGDRHLAGVDRDLDVDLVGLGLARVERAQPVLHEHAALDRVGRALEGDEERVADRLDQPAVEVRDDRHEEGVVRLQPLHQRVAADRLGVAREARDVGEHHGQVLLGVLDRHPRSLPLIRRRPRHFDVAPLPASDARFVPGFNSTLTELTQ